MRFRDVRMTRIKNAIYPAEFEPPTPILDGIPEPTPRWLSRYIGKTANQRNKAKPLIFPEPIANRAERRKNGQVRQRPPRLPRLTAIELPWKTKEGQDH